MQCTKFKLARVRAGILQVDLALRARIDRSRLSMIECGWRVASGDELGRIASALGVSTDELREAAKDGATI